MATRSKKTATADKPTVAEKKQRRTRNAAIDRKAGKSAPAATGRKKRTGWKHTDKSKKKISRKMIIYWKTHPFAKLRRKAGVRTKMPVEKTLRYVRQKEREARKAERASKRESMVKMRAQLKDLRATLKMATDGRNKKGVQSKISALTQKLAGMSPAKKRRKAKAKPAAKTGRKKAA